MSMDDILKDEEPTQEESSNQEQPEDNSESVETRDADDTGDNVETEPENNTEKEEKTVPLEAHISERKKRQELERQVRELERKYSYAQGKADSMPAKEVEPDNEKLVDDLLEKPHEILQKERKLTRQEVLDELWQMDANDDANHMTDKHEDYAQKQEDFLRLAENDPSLQSAIRRTRKPAQYIYKYMSNLEMKVDPVNFESKLRKKIEAELESKYKNAQAKEAAASTPTTQARARGAPPVGDKGFEKLSLSSIIGNKHFDD